MSSGYKYLAKNIGLLTVSNFATKILSFFLVPLYTEVLSTEDYGTFDLLHNTINVLIPILTLNISESVMRFSLDKKSNPVEIFSVGIKYFLYGAGGVSGVLVLNHVFQWSEILNRFWFMFILMYMIGSLLGIVSNFTRGLALMKIVAISGVVGTCVTITLNLIFLLPLHMGVRGYFLATIGGGFSQIIYQFIGTKAWKYISLKKVDDKLNLSMREYSIPLIANSVSWWVNNVSDRYIVTMICGIAENGIYAMGSKIPSIINIIQTIFNQAWTLSAVKDFDAEDKDGFFSKLYNLYTFIMVLGCSVIIILDRPIARILYLNDFYNAWKYVPFLTIAVMFGALSGYVGGIFAAVKDSRNYAKSTVVGAVINLIMNLILVRFLGALGAAFATTISYWIIWAIRIRKLKQYMNIKLYLIRDYIAFVILGIQSVMLLVMEKNYGVTMYLMEIVFLIVLMGLYHREIKVVVEMIKKLCEKKENI